MGIPYKQPQNTVLPSMHPCCWGDTLKYRIKLSIGHSLKQFNLSRHLCFCIHATWPLGGPHSSRRAWHFHYARRLHYFLVTRQSRVSLSLQEKGHNWLNFRGCNFLYSLHLFVRHISATSRPHNNHWKGFPRNKWISVCYHANAHFISPIGTPSQLCSSRTACLPVQHKKSNTLSTTVNEALVYSFIK